MLGRFMECFTPGSGYPAPDVPSVYSNISKDSRHGLVLDAGDGLTLYWDAVFGRYSPEAFIHAASGTDGGLFFDFGVDIEGTLYYGFYFDQQDLYSFFPGFEGSAQVSGGRVQIDIPAHFSGGSLPSQWQSGGHNPMVYRVADASGRIIYDGRLHVSGGGPFVVVPAISEGPYVNRLTHERAVISFRTSHPVTANVAIKGQIITGDRDALDHNIVVEGLSADSTYRYHVRFDNYRFSSSFSTPPAPGDSRPFSFAFASNSISGQGGGDRDRFGIDAHALGRAAQLALKEQVSFVQFSGNLARGPVSCPQEARLQYANWKRVMEPLGHQLPVFTTMGHHDRRCMVFSDGKEGGVHTCIDGFPFDTASSEALFQEYFLHFANGPNAELAALYYIFDGDTGMVNEEAADAISGSTLWPGAGQYMPQKTFGTGSRFPTYMDNVYSYTWGNVGMIVMNSAYWQAGTEELIPSSSGNPPGYFLDNQIRWLSFSLRQMEEDPAIDHVFITVSAPVFPAGEQNEKGSWHGGNNQVRPYINGKPHEKGVIERRDELLNLMVNKSTKAVALLSGDNRTGRYLLVNNDLPRYTEEYNHEHLPLERAVWQLSAGIGGDKEDTDPGIPWSSYYEHIAAGAAMIIIQVDGPKVHAQMVHPETGKLLHRVPLR